MPALYNLTHLMPPSGVYWWLSSDYATERIQAELQSVESDSGPHRLLMTPRRKPEFEDPNHHDFAPSVSLGPNGSLIVRRAYTEHLQQNIIKLELSVMLSGVPDYLGVSAEALGAETSVEVHTVNSVKALAAEMAHDMLRVILEGSKNSRPVTMIIPVGPIDQFTILAELINHERIDCCGTMLINMDEYLTGEETWVPLDHPLSFRGYMQREFYDRLDSSLAPLPENRVFPDPKDCGAISDLITARGGVDACFGGIGINGHLAFNEPPEPGTELDVACFGELPTRVLELSRETRTINSVTVGGEISIVPQRAVTVGMKEILASKQLRFYCNRPWQSSVVRRVLHGPITSACPASLLRLHANAILTVTDQVAQPPQIQLR